jgi:hypothetical protein
MIGVDRRDSEKDFAIHHLPKSRSAGQLPVQILIASDALDLR